MKNFLTLLKFAIPYKRNAILNVVFNLFYVLFALFSFSLLIPFLDILFNKNTSDYQLMLANKPTAFSFSAGSIASQFNYYIAQTIVEQGKFKALLLVCSFVLLFTLLKNIFRYLAMYIVAPLRNGIIHDLRKAMFAKLLNLPLSFYSEEKKGDIMSRCTNDVQDIEWSVMQSLEALTREPINIIGFLVCLVYMSPQLTMFVFLLLPIMGFLIGRVGKSLKRASTQSKEMLGSLLSVIEESLGGLRIIKSFNAKPFISSKFNAINNDYNQLMIKVYRRVDLAGPVSETLGVTLLVGVMLYGGKLVLTDNALQPSVFIAYVAIFSQLIPPIKSFSTAIYNAQKGIASAERINKILLADDVIHEAVSATSKTNFDSEIEFKNVSFAYTRGDEGLVLKNINLIIPRGKTIALVGQSGSGKTTLADLIPRFHDVSSGQLLIDGVNIKQLQNQSLNSMIGIVSQEAILFNDTVMNNISFGLSNVKEIDIIAAAKAANAHDFIMAMPQGYATNIGDRGTKLSGGQRQRLSIARALLKNPQLLILDEATSALDTESERLVQDALQTLMQNRTSIVIAHRLSTIQHANEIIVLHQGEIAERGTHTQLLAKAGVYKKLCDMQSFDN
jgi:ATP-binding cassette, subfamily B, bacterial MsbA